MSAQLQQGLTEAHGGSHGGCIDRLGSTGGGHSDRSIPEECRPLDTGLGATSEVTDALWLRSRSLVGRIIQVCAGVPGPQNRWWAVSGLGGIRRVVLEDEWQMFDTNDPMVSGAEDESKRPLIAGHLSAALAHAVSISSFRPETVEINGGVRWLRAGRIRNRCGRTRWLAPNPLATTMISI